MIFIHKPILQRIISFLGPWDRTQHAPLVNKFWASIVKDPNTHKYQPIPNQPARRMAWLVWKHVLEQNGKYEKLILKAIPYPCHLRHYKNIIDRLCEDAAQNITGMYHPHEVLLQKMIPSYYIIEIKRYPDRYTIYQSVAKFFGLLPGDRISYIICWVRIFLSWIDPKIWVDFHKHPFAPGQKTLKQVYERLVWALETNFGIVDINLGKMVRKIIEKN